MTRRPSKTGKYANRKGKPAAARGRSFDADEPVAGFYTARLVRDGPPVALHFWFGPPVDPDTGEPMDRAPVWHCLMNGQPVDVSRFWPECAKRQISQDQYLHIRQRSKTLDPADPYFDPMKPIDASKAAPPF